MNTVQEQLNRIFSDKGRDVGGFRPPAMKVIAKDLGIPLWNMRDWFHTYQLKTESPDWYRLHQGAYEGFLDWLQLTRLIEDTTPRPPPMMYWLSYSVIKSGIFPHSDRHG